jgi:hypothetical protein
VQRFCKQQTDVLNKLLQLRLCKPFLANTPLNDWHDGFFSRRSGETCVMNILILGAGQVGVLHWQRTLPNSAFQRHHHILTAMARACGNCSTA